MARSSEKELGRDLEVFRRKRGINQKEMASSLGISQPHLSRIISGEVAPGNKLAFRIREMLSTKAELSTDLWSREVREAANRSRSFKRLIDSALEILNRR